MKSSAELDFVKLVSALAIVNYHTAKLAVPVFGQFARFGFVFNTVFMLLSGFLLSMARARGSTPSPGAFLRRRLTKIFPPYHVALAAIVGIYLAIGRPVEWAAVGLSLTGVQYLFGNTALGPHLWFVAVILVCYAAFLPTRWAVRRLGWPFVGGLVGGFVALYALRERTLFDVYTRISANVTYRVLYHYLAFATGILLQERRGNLRLLNGWAALSTVLVLLGLYQLIYARPSLGLGTTAVAFALALAVIPALSAAYTGLFARWKVTLLLSGVTYEIYLVHYAVIDALDTVVHGKLVAWPLVFAGTIALALVVARGAKGWAWVIDKVVARTLSRSC